MTKRQIEYWVIPPEQDAEFVACMEDVLETYAAAHDPQHPALCMDEQPVQSLKETRVPIAATREPGKRVDYEYERNGTASIFPSYERGRKLVRRRSVPRSCSYTPPSKSRQACRC